MEESGSEGLDDLLYARKDTFLKVRFTVPHSRTSSLRPLYLSNLCSHSTSAFVSTSSSKFNITSMVTQMQTQRMSLKPFSVLMFAIDTMLNFDGDANADVKRE